MTAPKPWTEYFWRLVETKGPLPYARVIAESTKFVPPGRGYRETLSGYESHKKRYAQIAAAEGRTRKSLYRRPDEETMIRAGARAIVRASLRVSFRDGRLEQFYDNDGVRMVRLGPRPPKYAPHRPKVANKK